MRRSKILEKLRAGKSVLLTNISLGPMAMAVEMAGRSGIDGVWIDMEHRPYGQREVAEMIAGARLGDTDAMVRIRKGEGYTSFFRPLEDGAAGIMVPHITTGEEAAWVARNSKFAPIGRRGVENVMQDADVGFANTMEYLAHANRETFVAIQIEDAEALDKLDDIAGTQGFEILFIGPADLSVSLGVPFQFDSPKYREAEAAVRKAAQKHGKWWGRPVADAKIAAAYAEQGARFFNIGGDYGFLRAGFANIRKSFDESVASAK